MQTQVEGTTAAFSNWMVMAGYDGKTTVSTPFPSGTFLSLFDPTGSVTESEAKEVKSRGYNIVVGLIVWAALMCYPELKYATSMLSRVLSSLI